MDTQIKRSAIEEKTLERRATKAKTGVSLARAQRGTGVHVHPEHLKQRVALSAEVFDVVNLVHGSARRRKARRVSSEKAAPGESALD